MLTPKYNNQKSEITSYNFTDIVSGLGYTNFYGLICSTSSSTTYDLVLNKAYSETVETIASAIGTTTCNFDSSTFNLPRFASGIAYISVQCVGTGGGVMHLEAQVQKIATDGTTITNISSNILTPDYSGAVYPTVFLKIPLTNMQISIGEKLRLVIGLVVEVNAKPCGFAHDPMNRDGTTYIKPSLAQGATSVLNFYMPFRIDE